MEGESTSYQEASVSCILDVFPNVEDLLEIETPSSALIVGVRSG